MIPITSSNPYNKHNIRTLTTHFKKKYGEFIFFALHISFIAKILARI